MKNRRVVNQYTGRLTVKQVADGMNAAKRNAERLLEDAKILGSAKRFPSACALAILSIEEIGKLHLLRTIAIAKDDRLLKDAWKRYRNHQAKNVLWIMYDLVKNGARKLNDLRPIFDEGSDHPALVDAVKQLGIYTDCLGKAHWSEPEEVVDEGLAKSMIFIAQTLLAKRETSEREIELWVERCSALSVDTLFNFFEAIISEGLCDRPIEEIKDFLS